MVLGTGTFVFKDGEERRFPFLGSVRLHVLVSDEAGEIISESHTKRLPTPPLSEGFFGGCEVARRLPSGSEEGQIAALRALPRAEFNRYAMAAFAVRVFLDIAVTDASLGPLLAEVVRRPSIWSMLTGVGEGIGAEFQLDSAQPFLGALPIEAESAYLVPIELHAFGSLALEASMVVIQPADPIHPSAGVVSIAGVRPDDRQFQVHLQLQALGRITEAETARIRTGF
jgi:hypothetical protein